MIRPERPAHERWREAIRKQAPKGFAAGLLGSIIASRVLGIFLRRGRPAGVGLPAGLVGGTVVGVLVWFGFLMTPGVSGAIFEGRSGNSSESIMPISSSHIFVMGAVLGIWV